MELEQRAAETMAKPLAKKGRRRKAAVEKLVRSGGAAESREKYVNLMSSKVVRKIANAYYHG